MNSDSTPPEVKLPAQPPPAQPPPVAETSSEAKKPTHWLLEGVFIVISVALGFAVTEYGQYRNERQLAAKMLDSVRAEVEYNRAALAPYVPIHRAWQAAMENEGASSGPGSAFEAVFEKRPQLPPQFTTNVPLYRRAAWDTALSTGTLRLIDYDLAAGLSEIYGMQDYAGGMFPKLFSEPAFFDPSARAAALKLSQITMRELVFAEETLLALYDKQLPAIRGRSGG